MQEKQIRWYPGARPGNRSAGLWVSQLVMSLFVALHFGWSPGVLLGQSPDGLLPNRNSKTPTARVSPVLEIEILDPNQDARGNPAVVVGPKINGVSQIDIPPSLIVHRFYYTGDRSFRGPNFPGGPSIVIANNPRTGMRVYVPVQMLPGSPVVHYTSRRIEYDFGDRAVIVSFPKVGDPIVKFRNGRPRTEKVISALGIDKLTQAAKRAKDSLAGAQRKASTLFKGAGQAMGDLIQPITLPIQNFASIMPGASALTDPNLEVKILERSALEKRQSAVDRAVVAARINSLDIVQ